MAFDHQDRQTLRHLTSFCGIFLKERLYNNNTTSLEDFKHNNEGILVALINKIFYKLQGKNAAKK